MLCHYADSIVTLQKWILIFTYYIVQAENPPPCLMGKLPKSHSKIVDALTKIPKTKDFVGDERLKINRSLICLLLQTVVCYFSLLYRS
jgi:hypothetical protein